MSDLKRGESVNQSPFKDKHFRLSRAKTHHFSYGRKLALRLQFGIHHSSSNYWTNLQFSSAVDSTLVGVCPPKGRTFELFRARHFGTSRQRRYVAFFVAAPTSRLLSCGRCGHLL